MSDVITIQNGTDVEQAAYDVSGKKHVLIPHAVLPFPTAVARLFLEQRSSYVSVWKSVRVPPAKAGEQIVYVANVTGNPFLPQTVDWKYLDKATKLERIEKIPNPLRTPFPIRRLYAQPQVIGMSPGGTKTTFSTPAIPVVIPPWQRVAVPLSCAEWLTRRDAQQEEHFAGALIMARAPAAFEPNETWELHEMMVFARLMDDKAQGWISEKEAFKALDSNDDVKLAELKIKLLNQLFYRLVDERYALPPKEAFDAALQAALVEFKKSAKSQPSARA